MKKEAMLNNMMVGNGVEEKGGKEMVATILKENETTIENNEGGNKMLKENEAVRCHCLHCNAVLNKKGRKYCDRDCYNASRKKSVAKNVVVETVVAETAAPAKESVKEPVSSGVANNLLAFEKALCNMQKFGSRLTLHRLKKLIEIAGERAHVIRVGGGVAIYWVINNKGYTLYYAPGKKLSYKESDFKEMKTSIEKLVTHKTFKDAMSITEYVELAEQMKGGE